MIKVLSGGVIKFKLNPVVTTFNMACVNTNCLCFELHVCKFNCFEKLFIWKCLFVGLPELAGILSLEGYGLHPIKIIMPNIFN